MIRTVLNNQSAETAEKTMKTRIRRIGQGGKALKKPSADAASKARAVGRNAAALSATGPDIVTLPHARQCDAPSALRNRQEPLWRIALISRPPWRPAPAA